jgi:hypothetical protein
MNKLLSVALLILFCFISAALSYGPDGHQVIAEVAYRLVSKQVRNKIDRMTDGYQLWSLATLPDDFNHNPGGEWAKSIHFINVNGPDGIQMSRDCKKNDCIITALQNYTQILMKKQENDDCSPRKKTEKNPNPEPCALSNLVHLVGDIHQPLHCSNELDLPRGGNLLKVTVDFVSPGGQRYTKSDVRLHQVWDSGMLFQYKRINNYSNWKQIADDVMKAIADDPKMLKNVNLDFKTWAKESMTLTATAMEFDRKNKIVDQKYYDLNMPVVLERLTDGGVRLAALLEKILGSK